ncbi:PstS family phosphate ABC transporter substrate-binding protein [Limnobacter sp.]|uniref:PstS family phosphate ABC transporter substrate-binding protein n=1 Tax=Limnobacter sp. TaxID=2003368 RepID=UPI00391BCC03
MRMFKLSAMTAVMAAAFAATPALADDVVKMDGSSTVYPISEAVAEEFQKAEKGKIRVTVGVSGTGGGFKKFCRGETDFSGASRQIKDSERADCAKNGIKFIEVPVAFDALTVVVHPSNTWASTMTPAQLKKAWEPSAQGKIMNWKDIDPSFPDQALKLYGPGADSGTFDYFTEEINGKSKAIRGDFTASEDDNVLVQGVSRDRGGMGYFGLAYYEENKDKLKAVAIVNKAGKPVLPSLETVNNLTYNPLARPLFMYVAVESLKKPNVKKFMDFTMKNVSKLSKEVGYVDLPANFMKAATKRYNDGLTGTVFTPENADVPMDKLLTMKGKD